MHVYKNIVKQDFKGEFNESSTCLIVFVNSTVRSTSFTTKDIVVSGSDDRTVKVFIHLYITVFIMAPKPPSRGWAGFFF